MVPFIPFYSQRTGALPLTVIWEIINSLFLYDIILSVSTKLAVLPYISIPLWLHLVPYRVVDLLDIKV